jgi:putative inorganic carbon (HCO3(-)) transporter
MRDFIVIAIILGSVPICFLNPYFGVLMWNWVAIFNPHRFTWGFAYHFPVATVVALPTLAGMIFTRKINHRIFTRESILLLLLWVWFAVTIFHATTVPMFSEHITAGTAELVRVSKVLLMTFVTILLVTSKNRLRWLFLVIGLSIGLLAVKGALFGLRTGGESRVWGPPDSFIADNNDLALATNMALPLLFFLAAEEKRRWLRIGLRLIFVAGLICVILSYSRGGLLGLAIVLSALAIKSKHKLLTAAFVVVCGFLVFSYAPEKWMDRMSNFYHGNLDTSAEGRIGAWHFAVALAHQYPLTGGGFQTFTPDLFERITPETRFAGPHSIYFQMLGEQGYVGLTLFLLLLGGCWFSLRRMAKYGRHFPELHWVVPYAHMLQASILAYMVSGAFLPRAYFDFFYTLVAAVIAMKIIFQREVSLLSVAKQERNAAMELPEAGAPSIASEDGDTARWAREGAGSSIL